MQVSKIQNQPNFQANFSKDQITQNILSKIRRSSLETNSHQLTNSAFDIIGLVRKNQTLSLNVVDNKLVASIEEPKTFISKLLGKFGFGSKSKPFESEIFHGNLSDAFAILASKVSRLW